MPFRALIDACWKEKYTAARFTRDLIAGITVGIIAIPLAMALAIGSGVAPQYGLYTAAVAGIVIALTGGSRFSVSGPTAAFVVILYPVSQQFGLAGLLVATLLSGIFLILMGLAREKARAGVAQTAKDLPVLGADTIVILNGEVLEKPRDAEHAAQMLRKLSGQTQFTHRHHADTGNQPNHTAEQTNSACRDVAALFSVNIRFL